VSETDKENNYIIMLSDSPIAALNGAQFIKIPKGDVGKLTNPIEQFLSFADGQDADTAGSIGKALMSFLPIDRVTDLIPTAIKPLAEVATNRSFFQNIPIVPDYKENYPANLQYSSYTAPLYKMIGDRINVSPAKIQAVVEGYGTGLARIGEMAVNPLVPDRYKKESSSQPINRTPLLRRFLGGAKRTPEEQALMESYDQPTEMETLLKENANDPDFVDNFNRIKESEAKDKVEKNTLSTQADTIAAELMALPLNQRPAFLAEKVGQDRDLATKVRAKAKEIYAEQNLAKRGMELTPVEKLVKGYGTSTRAQELVTRLDALDKAEKQELVQRWRMQGIITKAVEQEMVQIYQQRGGR